jgi:hypothetical protein
MPRSMRPFTLDLTTQTLLDDLLRDENRLSILIPARAADPSHAPPEVDAKGLSAADYLALVGPVPSVPSWMKAPPDDPWARVLSAMREEHPASGLRDAAAARRRANRALTAAARKASTMRRPAVNMSRVVEALILRGLAGLASSPEKTGQSLRKKPAGEATKAPKPGKARTKNDGAEDDAA